MSPELSLLFNTQTWILPFIYALFGLCIGSYLNVVIYRLPRGLSTYRPSHSYCPRCNTPLAWYYNIPVVSWLCLRARSACCKQSISWQYPLVELATALLFAGIVARSNAPLEQLVGLALLCLWASCALVIWVMDWQEMIVMPSITVIASIIGLAALSICPELMLSCHTSWYDGLSYSLAGMGCGFALLKLVAWLGELALGRRSTQYSSPQSWKLCATPDGEDIELHLADQRYLYSELLLESRDHLILRDAQLLRVESVAKGNKAQKDCLDKSPAALTLASSSLTLGDGSRLALEDYNSLSGVCMGYKHQRSVLGSGDAWIVMAMGAVCGWQGALFCLFAGSVIGLIAALVMRMGRSRPIPFGPSLILAALLWIFGASDWPRAYMALFE